MSVLFDNLRVVGARSGATYQNNVGDIALTPLKIIQGLFLRRKDPEKTILHGIDGVVHVGEMLLVLGRPGSGCSTLLKNLAASVKAMFELREISSIMVSMSISSSVVSVQTWCIMQKVCSTGSSFGLYH
jgi:energy-coupling factor transporter ATP-binding protein EcfA2